MPSQDRASKGPLMRGMGPLTPDVGPNMSGMDPLTFDMGPLNHHMDPLRPGMGLLMPGMGLLRPGTGLLGLEWTLLCQTCTLSVLSLAYKTWHGLSQASHESSLKPGMGPLRAHAL